jgi:hypothetical protein
MGRRQRLLAAGLALAAALGCAWLALTLPLGQATRLAGQQWMLDELGQALLCYTYVVTAVLVAISAAAGQVEPFAAPALASCSLLSAAVLARSPTLSFLLFPAAAVSAVLTASPPSHSAARGGARWLVCAALPVVCVPAALSLLERSQAPGAPALPSAAVWLVVPPLVLWLTLFPFDGTMRLWSKERLSLGSLFLWAVKDWAVAYLFLLLWQQNPELRSEHTLALVGVAGLATAVISGALGFVQTQPSGVLACAAMSALGIAVQGLTAGSLDAAQSALFLLAHRSLAVLLSGAALAALPFAGARDAESSAKDLRWRRPLVLAAFAVGILALAGLPPLGGFARGQIQPLLVGEQSYLSLAWLSASAGIALGLARSAWTLWHTKAEPTADPRADLPLLLVVALLLLALSVALRPQGLARWLAELFGELLPALKTG